MRPALERLCCRVKHKWGPYEEKYGMYQSGCERESCVALRRMTKVTYELGQKVRRAAEAQLLAINRYQDERGKIKWRRYAKLPVSTEPMEGMPTVDAPLGIIRHKGKEADTK